MGLTVDPTIDLTVKITGQPLSRTQANDASGRLPRYEAKCVQRTCFQSGSDPLRSKCALLKGGCATLKRKVCNIKFLPYVSKTRWIQGALPTPDPLPGALPSPGPRWGSAPESNEFFCV